VREDNGVNKGHWNRGIVAVASALFGFNEEEPIGKGFEKPFGFIMFIG